jgi:HD-GYP domain-containing protein (c-di-GMP phosphodiesterase class II)/DNA-binding CsgD family transcriptional regulator
MPSTVGGVPGTLRLADLLGGLSMVADYGFGLPPGTAMRTALVAAALGRRMGLADGEVRDGLYAGLLAHLGCVGISHEAAAMFGDDIGFYRAITRTDPSDPEAVLTAVVAETGLRVPVGSSFLLANWSELGRQGDTGVCEVGRDTARRLGLPESTQQALYHLTETWAGGWVPHGLKGDDIAVASRLGRAAMEVAFFSHMGGPAAAVAALRERSGGVLDPAVVAAFAADPRGILADVDEGDPHDLLLAVEPEPVLTRSASDLTGLAAAFGDLADLKTPFLHGHSRRVAELASGGARRLGLDAADVRRVELAGFLHDIGRVGVSNAVWEKRGPLTRPEWEQVRMHGYYSERIVATSSVLAPLAPLVGLHHERLDGSGYHRCCAGAAIPTAARLVAVADAFAAMLAPRPHRPALSTEQAVDALAADTAAGRFDHDATHAVLAEAGHSVRPARRVRPAGLSDREVEVLTLIAAGCSNAEVARRLVISRRTAEHHAQHIYAKIGVSTRAAAALFAVQHDLVRPA